VALPADSLLSPPQAPPKFRKSKKAPAQKFVIDCSKPVDDGLMECADFEKFLTDRIKVNGKTGVLGEDVVITRDGSTLTVEVNIEFSKRYLKYLTKKFLKNKQLKDWLHVIATDKQSYELRYYNIHEDEDDEGED